MQELIDTVIWDFNGTLIDDVDLAVGAMNVLLHRRGLPAIDRGRHRGAFGHPVSGYYAALGVDLDREDLAALSDEFHERYLTGVGACSRTEGALELLSAFRDRGIRQYILSAAQQEMLESWVAMLDLDGFFAGVYGLADRLAATKVTRGRELLEAHGIQPSTTVLIGDTDHDVEVAAALGCRAVLVTLGHQSAERLGLTGAEIYASFGALREAVLT